MKLRQELVHTKVCDGCVAVGIAYTLAGDLGITTPMIFVGSAVTAGLDDFASKFDAGNVNKCVLNLVEVSLLLSAIKIKP